MAYTDIDKPTDYFETELYSGSSSDVTMNALDFQPDWVWLKKRSSSGDNLTYDSVRGTNKRLTINGNDAEVDRSSNNDELKSFNSDGWTLGTYNSNVTGAGSNCVSFNWKAGGSSTSSNSDGSITSSVSANTTAGFSILTFTGTGSSATVGHGLGAVPKMILFKKTSGAQGWGVYHAGVGNTGALRLDGTDATDTTSNYFNNTSPTSSVFTVNTNNSVNNSGGTMLAYCFAEKKGYSKFGSYTGNGNADGTFVFTGMKISWLLLKRTDSADNWYLYDNKRDTENPQAVAINADASGAEFTTSNTLDFISNGFKLRSSEATTNASGGTYIYMAFAESPFVNSNGVPTNAR